MTKEELDVEKEAEILGRTRTARKGRLEYVVEKMWCGWVPEKYAGS